MPSRSRSLQVAGGSAVLGLLGLVATSREFQHASEVASEDPEGLVAGFAAFFALSFLVTCLLALGEAGLLAAVVLRFDPPPWANRLLVAGAAAGGLAVLPRVVLTLEHVIDVNPPVELLGAWWLLAAFGVFFSGLGVLVHAVGPLNRNQELSLRGALLVLVLFVTASALTQLVDERMLFGVSGVGVLLAALGVFCFGLGTLLNPVGRASRNQETLSRGAVLAPVLLGFAVTVFQVLAGALFFATLVGLASLVTLWAVWSMVLQP